MAYQLRTDCQQVTLYVLIGADPSLVGLSVHNCKVISISYVDFANLVIQTYGREALLHFSVSISEGEFIPTHSDLTVLEIVDSAGRGIDFYDRHFFALLKLFKAEDIFPCYSMVYSCKDGVLTNPGFRHRIEYKHAVVPCDSRYGMEEAEKASFEQWFDKYASLLFRTEINEQFRNMLRSYDQSFLIGIPEMEYIMLFSILEMLFGTGNTEITYQISRGTALLLSSTSEEMNTTYKQMKKLYTVRSKYVHNGVDVPLINVYQLREIVRRVLIKLVDLGYHASEKTFDDLRTVILLGGYHTFVDTEKEI